MRRYFFRLLGIFPKISVWNPKKYKFAYITHFFTTMRKIVLAIFTLICSTSIICCRQASAGDNSNTMKSTDIIKKMKDKSELIIHDKRIEGNLNLTEAGTGALALEMAPAYVNCELVFVNCEFADTVRANDTRRNGVQIVYCVFSRNVTFRNCKFAKSVDFQQAEFLGRFDFFDCTVEGEANFSGINSTAGSSFTGTGFNGDALFVSATLNRRTSFAKANFKETANFQYCHIGDIATFTDAVIGGYTDFSNTRADALCDFTNSQFGGRVNFQNSTFLGLLKMSKCVFTNSASFSGNKFLSGLNLVNARFEKHLEMVNNIFATEPKTNGAAINHDDADLSGNKGMESINLNFE